MEIVKYYHHTDADLKNITNLTTILNLFFKENIVTKDQLMPNIGIVVSILSFFHKITALDQRWCIQISMDNCVKPSQCVCHHLTPIPNEKSIT